jgi:hypothetical protein
MVDPWAYARARAQRDKCGGNPVRSRVFEVVDEARTGHVRHRTSLGAFSDDRQHRDRHTVPKRREVKCPRGGAQMRIWRTFRRSVVRVDNGTSACGA